MSELRNCVNGEVGLGSHSLSHSAPVLNKPYGFCGRNAPWKDLHLYYSILSVTVLALPHLTKGNLFNTPHYHTASVVLFDSRFLDFH